MKIIRVARKFELYKKKVFIIDVCLALISTPTRGVVIRKNILARVSQSLPPTPLGGSDWDGTSVCAIDILVTEIWLKGPILFIKKQSTKLINESDLKTPIICLICSDENKA